MTQAAQIPRVVDEQRPGFAEGRLVRLMTGAIRACRLDLSGIVVLTEAATGAYVVTPVLAAMAGASQVVALTRTTHYGTVDQVTARTMSLARRAGVESRITVTSRRCREDVEKADLITNSGHVRPIDADVVGCMRPSAVVPLMFEAWEVQADRLDVDLDAMRRRGIAFAGTNERHHAVAAFDYLGLMAVRLLLDAGLPAQGSRITVLCDCAFGPYLVRDLERAGAVVSPASAVAELDWRRSPDAILVAMRPRRPFVVDEAAIDMIARRWPGVPFVQFWGDLDRAALDGAGLPCWPPTAPPPGHMGVLPSDIGPDPVVRLQAGGLKVGSVLLTPPERRSPFDVGFLDEL
jgi:hypothetical protein